MALKCNRGFALVLMTSLLPVLLALFLATFAVLAFIQTDQHLQYACRSEGIKGQQKVAPLLKSLLALNKLSVALRIQEVAAKAKLAAVLVTGNPAAIAAAEAHLAKIQNRQLNLDTKQKQIIKQSDLLLMQAHAQGERQITNTIQNLNQFNSLLKLGPAKQMGFAPKLAVHPNSTDIAPTYSPDEDFDEKQALAHTWQYRLSVNPRLQRFISGSFRFQKSCAVTLKEKELVWQPKIKRDKF